jgi:hypothetical protein
MCKSIPLNLIRYIKDMSGIELNNFFGFCLAEITCGNEVLRPVLPYKYKGKTIYPRGQWISVYFSEELKAVEKLGYKINLIRGYEFEKYNLFNDYINHFYNQKLNCYRCF